MPKWDKNATFRHILLGYMVAYACLIYYFNKPADYTFDKRSIGDLMRWLSRSVIQHTLTYLVIHYIGCKYAFPIIADKCIIASKYQYNLREKRIVLVSTHLFKFLCYCYIFYRGYTAMRDADWLPREFLFGPRQHTGREIMPWLVWDHDRFAHHNLPLAVQQYFEWSAAYHLHSMVWHLTFSRGAFNFYEMLLHHFVTASLVVFCYLTGHTGIGVLVSFIHDGSDIPAYAIKLAVNTSQTVMTLTIYLFLLICWIYYRVICFGRSIIYPIYLVEYKLRVIDGKGFQEPTVYLVLLSTLWTLHLFWIGLFIKIGMKYLKRGVIHDTQETKRSEYSDTDSE